MILRRDTASGRSAPGDPPLLGYTVTSVPDPIQVSTASAPATAVISVSVAPLASKPVYCNQITIYVYVGTDEQALSADALTSGVNRSSWSPSESDIKSAEALGLPGTADDNYYYATYGCSVTADFDIDYPLIFTLEATVNTVPGPFTLNFEETSALTKDPSSFTPRDTAVPMTKADSVFYLDNFIATVAGTPAVPASEFANGAANRIVFSWAGNGTGYTLFAGMPATQIYTGQAKTFTLPAGASVDTTYTLQAEQVSGGAPPEFLYRSLTLTVSNPDLTPKSVAATGNATIGGTATVSGALTASGGATVTGAATISGQASVGGALNANGGITFAGGLTGDKANLSGGLYATYFNASESMSARSFSTSESMDAFALFVSSAGIGFAQPTAWLINRGPGPALVTNAGSIFPSIRATNTVSDPSHTTGIYATVASSSDWGLCTNGQVGTSGGSTVFSHVPTRAGMRVVTAPITLEEELHAAGEGRLKRGRAKVPFPPELADAIHHSAAHAYRVQLTPTGHCNGLAVVAKTPEGFSVEELGNGRGGAGFDWFIVARRPLERGSAKVRTMPKAFPEALKSADPPEEEE